MTLEEAVADFEARFIEITRVVGYPKERPPLDCLGRDWSRAPTGEAYVAWCTGGVKLQGARFPVFTKSRDKALELWIEHLPVVHLDDKLRLCWREGPWLEQNQWGRFAVYSRFAMTNKPFPNWVYDPAAMTREDP